LKTITTTEQVGYAIVVLPRGFVLVGEVHLTEGECFIERGSFIRRWGTTKGLGEIAENGPTNNTVLDPAHGTVRFHRNSLLFTLDTEEAKWVK
jgi:hypothetical protein